MATWLMMIPRPRQHDRPVQTRCMCFNVVIIPKVYLVPEAKLRDTDIPRVLLLLVNDSPSLLVPKAKRRDTNSIFYYYFYSVNEPNHLSIVIITSSYH